VSAAHAVPATVRLYDRLFTVPNPNAADDFMDVLNPDSLETVEAMLEPALARLAAGEAVQFERLGYFSPDARDSGTPGRRSRSRRCRGRTERLPTQFSKRKLRSAPDSFWPEVRVTPKPRCRS
jgi:hypothetical protein